MIDKINNSNINNKISKLPHLPGIYKMLSEDGKVIYVGKAKDLKKRVSSYFQNKDQPIRTQKLVENIQDIEWIEVNSELEALILETNLIKQLMPKYNILMKDGKNFCYLKITLADRFPRVDIVRQIIKDGSKYYGPKTSNDSLNKSIKILQEIYPIVSDNIYRVNGYPKKVDYSASIKDLPGVTNEEYMKAINDVMDFFEGKYEPVHKRLQELMMKYAMDKQFEAAAKIRDYLNEFKKVHETQIISEPSETSQDIFGFKEMEDKTYVTLFQVRNGKLIGHENFKLEGVGSDEELIESLITQYYENTGDYPKEILLPISLRNCEEGSECKKEQILDKPEGLFEQWFKKNTGKKVKVILPQKGKKSKLIDLANQNAESFANTQEEKEGKDKEKLKKAFSEIYDAIFNHCVIPEASSIGISDSENGTAIQNPETNKKKNSRSPGQARGGQILKNYSIFNRIECFDISHFGGTNTVASMSVFTDGIADKKEYRHYNIQTLDNGKIDDFKAMYEVIDRRLKRIENDLSANVETNNHLSQPEFQFEKLTKKTFEKYSKEKPELFCNYHFYESGNPDAETRLIASLQNNSNQCAETKHASSLQYYLIKQGLNLIGLIHVYKYNDKLIEIDFKNSIFQCHCEEGSNPGDELNKKNESIIKNGNKENFQKLRFNLQDGTNNNGEGKNQIIQSFLNHCQDLFPEKSIWIYTKQNEEIFYIENGFKKLKTLDGELKNNKGLVPEEIAERCTETTGIYVNRIFGKKSKPQDPPAMILIDGGKGQLSSSYKAFIDNGWTLCHSREGGNPENKNHEGANSNSRLPIHSSVIQKSIGGKTIQILLISIAKQNEEIFGVGESNPYPLKNDCEGSFLLQRIRDEAHRFGLSHQQNKRDKQTKSSTLDKIKGIGDVSKFKLLQKFGSFEEIQKASDEEILKIVNKKILEEIRKI